MSYCWLLLRLTGPMMSCGSVRVDQINPTDTLPRLSQLAGLIGNALGLRSTAAQELQDIQDRMIYGAALLRPGSILQDDQNAQLSKDDILWTTEGSIKREGASYNGAHQRIRSYLADADIAVCLRMREGGSISTDQVREALIYPERPLFIGRKSCLPTRPIYSGQVEATTAREALQNIEDFKGLAAARLPLDEGLPANEMIADLKDWTNDIHLGERGLRSETLEFS